jgi:hypothetical protein
MPPGYGYLTHHLPRKVNLARMNNSAIDRQVVMLEARGKKTQLFNTTMKCLGLGGREKTCACYRQTVSAGSGIGRGSSSTLGVVFTLGGTWPGLGRRPGRKGPPPKGGRQHRASGCLGQAPAAATTSSLAWEAAITRADEVSFRADSASIRANTTASGSGSSQSSRGFSKTEQERPRAVRPTEPRDSYASGIRIPHSSPSAKGNSCSVKWFG